MWPLRRVDDSYYAFQALVGRALLVWGGVSVALGAVAQVSRDPFIKQYGLQSLAWGAIDAVIGLIGLRGAKRKQAERAETVPQARRFRLIVLLNALLDVGYVAAGLAALRRSQGRAERAGMGVGILVQGGFLLIFDIALSILSGRWTRS